jgi:uncharacterized membrane protein (UPF0136 family)
MGGSAKKPVNCRTSAVVRLDSLSASSQNLLMLLISSAAYLAAWERRAWDSRLFVGLVLLALIVVIIFVVRRIMTSNRA